MTVSPEEIEFWKWALMGLATAVGGSKGAIALARKGAAYIKTRSALKKERADVWKDNELFKTEVRKGLEDLNYVKTGIQRLDANIRAQAHLDPRPIFFTCDQGQITFINRQFTRHLGWTIDDMRNRGIVNAFHPDDQRRVSTEWEHAKRDRRDLKTKARLQHANGSDLGVARVEALVMRCTDESVFGWHGMLLIEGRQ